MKRLYHITRPLSLVFLILLSTCTISVLDEPVRVNFEISMANNSGTLEYLSFTQMIVSINSISFLGIRQEGDDVYFHTRPGQTFGTHALTSINNKSHATHFDIQQGNYQNMRWDITTGPIGTQFYDQTIFLDDDEVPEEYSHPGLLLVGNYTRLTGGTVKLYIAICTEQLLRAEIQSVNGTSPIPIIPDNIYTVTFEINPVATFSGIPRQMIEEAETETNDDETEYIVISPEENEELYNFILFRLAQNITATIR